MTSKEELTLLLERVQKATGPDREIDWDIADALQLIPAHRVIDVGWDHVWYRHPGETILSRVPGSDQFAGVESWSPLNITASLDAIAALIDSRLNDTPGVAHYPAEMTLSSVGLDGPWKAAIWLGEESDGQYVKAPTAPLALCAAFLQAMIAQVQA